VIAYRTETARAGGRTEDQISVKTSAGLKPALGPLEEDPPCADRFSSASS
jgi:hypothetical protein